MREHADDLGTFLTRVFAGRSSVGVLSEPQRWLTLLARLMRRATSKKASLRDGLIELACYVLVGSIDRVRGHNKSSGRSTTTTHRSTPVLWILPRPRASRLSCWSRNTSALCRGASTGG